jgi:hypothetical protein
MPELTERAASLFRFLKDHADAEGCVVGVTYHNAANMWEQAQSGGEVDLRGTFEVSADDFPEALAELVMKGRIDVSGQTPSANFYLKGL